MANAGMTKEKANNLLENGTADLVSFAALFLANPDLPRRFELDAPLNTPDKKTYYAGGEKGYTDYPFLDE
jgi:N-ethylmaleimide reductase